MNTRPPPRLISKRNRRRRNSPLYHVEIADVYWTRFDAEWSNLQPDERLHKKQEHCARIARFLNTRRPRKSVELIVTPRGEVRFGRVNEYGGVLVTPIYPRID